MHKHTNYEFWTVAMWTSEGDAPKLHTLGVDSSIDYTSETQLKGLWLQLDECADLFNASLLALRKQTSFSQDEFITKLHGTNRDHAADQKKDPALLHAWKEDIRNQQLGEKHIAKLPIDELITLLMAEKEKNIDELGGIMVWESLTLVDWLCHDKEILLNLLCELGGQEYEILPEPEKQKFGLFLWGGCCMDKDLNAVKGGDKAMSEFWKNSDLTPPVLLANKDNAAVLAFARPGSKQSTAKIHAEKVSEYGGIKTTMLGGLLFHYKDDKKGQQDIFSWLFSQQLGQEVTYPGTSSICYQSNCDGVEFILLHQDLLIEFMDHICYNKEKVGLMNLKKKPSSLPLKTRWPSLNSWCSWPIA